MWKNKISLYVIFILRIFAFSFKNVCLRICLISDSNIYQKNPNTPTSLLCLNWLNMMHVTCHKKAHIVGVIFCENHLCITGETGENQNFHCNLLKKNIDICRSLSIWEVKSRLKLIEPFIRWYNVCPEVHFSFRRVHVHVFKIVFDNFFYFFGISQNLWQKS